MTALDISIPAFSSLVEQRLPLHHWYVWEIQKSLDEVDRGDFASDAGVKRFRRRFARINKRSLGAKTE
jgi:hypothetical protein